MTFFVIEKGASMKQEIINIFPVHMREDLQRITWDGIEEIRVRIGWPVELIYDNRSKWLGNYDSIIDRQGLDEMLNYITGYSVYAMEEELKQGFVTLSGGHRIGVTGHTIYERGAKEGEYQITTLTDIGGLNIRIAHEKKGCAKDIVLLLRKDNSIYNTIFFAAPGIGKTTYLRDAIRILATGDSVFPGIKCCVVDERSEIAACRMGKPQNDLGIRTDVLDACPKEVGMRMVLRAMSPQIIAVDELGKEIEFLMLEQMRCSGVKVLGTMHAGSLEELFHNKMVRNSINKGTIERFVELLRLPDGNRGFHIYDGQGRLLWEK